MCPDIRQPCVTNLDVWARCSYDWQLRLSSRGQLEGTFLRFRTTISVSGMRIADSTDEEVEAMLDAFIIEQLKQEKEKEDVQPLPLTMELPNRDEKEEERKKREKKDRSQEKALVFRF